MPASNAKPLDYQERIVAFIDVLGFSELVKASDTDQTARVKIANLIMTNELFAKFVGGFLPRLNGEAAFFSDSFVLSMDYGRVFQLIKEIGYLCRRLLTLGLPCRGAITTGLLYHRERVVVGPALVDAYQLERSVAIYPRVILDDASGASWINEFAPPPLHAHCEAWVKKDHDGRHFIDIFHPAWPDCYPWTDFVPSSYSVPGNSADFLEAASEQIESGLAESRGNAKVQAKYSWLRSECNAHIGSLG
jgi:hypothetical protein